MSSHQILHAEEFQRAVNGFNQEVSRFQATNSDLAWQMQTFNEQFSNTVSRLSRVLGMQAENMQREHLGESMAYMEGDFAAA